MSKHKIVKYDFNQEHLGAFSSLLKHNYSPYINSSSYISRKIKNLSKENPFFKKGVIENFLAYESEKPIGHISAITDPRLRGEDGNPIGIIGFYEAINSDGLAKDLINSAVESLKSRSCRIIRGPIDLTIWNPYRFAIDQNPSEVFSGEMINLPHYPNHFLENGFTEARRYASLKRSDLDIMLDYGKNTTETLSSAGFSLTRLTKDNFQKYLPIIHNMSNTIFQGSWSYVPTNIDEFRFMYEGLENVLSLCPVELLSNPQGQEIGFAFGIPDPQSKSFVLKTIGVLPGKSIFGGVMLGASQLRTAKSMGFDSVIFALRKREKVASPIYEGASVREYVAFERTLS